MSLFFFFSVEVSNVKHTERQWGAVEEQTLDPNGPADPPLSLCIWVTLGVHNPQWMTVPSSVKMRVKRPFFVLLIFYNKNVRRIQWNKVLLHLSLLNTLSMHLLINVWFEVSPKIWSFTASTSPGRRPREDLKTHILVPLSVYAFMLFNQSWNLWSAWQTVCFSNPLSPLSVHAAFNLIFFKPTLLWLNLNSQQVVLTRTVLRACLVAQMGKNPPAMWETWIWSLGWEDPLEEGMATHQCSCLENPHGQRSLVGYSPWGSKESDVTEAA